MNFKKTTDIDVDELENLRESIINRMSDKSIGVMTPDNNDFESGL